ncbi:MAG: hypothetical protein WEE36_06620 [Acidimicrobiia bacterium]
MVRRILAAALATIVLIAPAAGAKGVDGVTLSSGDQTVTLGAPNGREFTASSGAQTATLYGGEFPRFLDSSRFFDGFWPQGSIGTMPSGPLGPRVIAEWNFPVPEPTVILQYLYPFAEGGPVGHIPGGQEYAGSISADSWFPLADDIVEQLEAVGFDTTRLVAPSGASIPLWAIGLGAALAIWGIIERRKQTRQVA